MSERRIRVGDVALNVHVEGNGPPLLLLHGFTGSAETMKETARSFPGHRTLRVDLLGHGRSDAPRSALAYTMPRCVDQLVAVIEACAGGAAHVLGYSMGGRAALALATAHPERVNSVLLIGARAGFACPEVRRERIASDEALADAIERDGVDRFVDRWMALPLFASQARLGPEYLAQARRQRLENRPHGLAGSLRGMGAGAQPPLFDRLPRLSVPTLVVVGAEDERFRGVADDLARRIPTARLEKIPDAGHAAHLENPDAFARIARSFLAGSETRSNAIHLQPEETCPT